MYSQPGLGSHQTRLRPAVMSRQWVGLNWATLHFYSWALSLRCSYPRMFQTWTCPSSEPDTINLLSGENPHSIAASSLTIPPSLSFSSPE